MAKMSDRYTLGDFGAGGERSTAGDALIDTAEAAKEAATSAWEFEASTSNVVGWHVPGTPTSLQLWNERGSWQLKRAGKLIGSAKTLADGLQLAEKYMEENPAMEEQ